jgi:AmmeMemoRadiSam system protein A
MSSIDAPLSDGDRETLLAVARGSIVHGLDAGSALRVDPERYPLSLKTRRPAFVTLHRGGELRGCIGHLEAEQPLVADVADNAYSAAFRDPRFPPLQREELADIEIHISVLSTPQPVTFKSEADLVHQLRPGIDGLILQDGLARGTFLPSVWESLAEPGEFLRHLKLKAGLSPAYWSDNIQVWRYQAESFPD